MTEARGTRVAAIVGPYLSGKTSLLENLLFVTGAVPRKGSVKEGNTVGDWAPEPGIPAVSEVLPAVRRIWDKRREKTAA